MPVVREIESSVKVKDPMNFVLIENGAISSIKYKRKYYGYKPIANGRKWFKEKRKRKKSRAHVAMAQPALCFNRQFFSITAQTKMLT